MEAKILITAQIRNIDIHLIGLGAKFQVIWCVQNRPLDSLLKADMPNSEKMHVVPLVARPIAYSTAMRRFRLLVRNARDPRIKFETV